METYLIELPTLYGDHHVSEVRSILLSLPGVSEVYASSAFHVVEVTFDPAQVSAEAIRARLDEAGYLGEMAFPVEVGAQAGQAADSPASFRHTAIYENTPKTVSFAQQVPSSGRPLWPCPGLGPVKIREE